MSFCVYLSGEIHTDWRGEVMARSKEAGLNIDFTAPVTDHGASDDCGAILLGAEDDQVWHDHKGAKINAIRTGTYLRQADLVVVRFGDKYKQWNAAFEAGQAAAMGIPLIVMHWDKHVHALKEIDAAAMAVVSTPAQLVDVLKYVITGKLEAQSG